LLPALEQEKTDSAASSDSLEWPQQVKNNVNLASPSANESCLIRQLPPEHISSGVKYKRLATFPNEDCSVPCSKLLR